MNHPLVIIPARGNSKGIPGKNLSKVGNNSLVGLAGVLGYGFAVENGGTLVLSSDSIEVVKEALKAIYSTSEPRSLNSIHEANHKEIVEVGERIYFHRRPSVLAQDNSRTIELIKHLISLRPFLDFRNFVLLQPTSPFRKLEELQEIWKFFKNNSLASLVSVARFDSPHPDKKIVRTPAGTLDTRLTDTFNLSQPRQELQTYWHLDGAYYVFTRDFIERNETFVAEETFLFERYGLQTINIDTELDLNFAQYVEEKKLLHDT